MKKINSVLEFCAKVLSVFSFVGTFLGVIFVMVDVVLRYVFSSPIPGDYDITQLWLSVIVMAALPYVQSHKGHINVTMLIKHFKPRLAVGCFAIGTLIGAFISGMCSYSCFMLAAKSFNRNMVSMMIQIPFGPFEIFEGICLALLCLIMLVQCISYFIALKDAQGCKDIVASWE